VSSSMCIASCYFSLSSFKVLPTYLCVSSRRVLKSLDLQFKIFVIGLFCWLNIASLYRYFFKIVIMICFYLQEVRDQHYNRISSMSGFRFPDLENSTVANKSAQNMGGQAIMSSIFPQKIRLTVVK
jgi:hypothetical protein